MPAGKVKSIEKPQKVSEPSSPTRASAGQFIAPTAEGAFEVGSLPQVAGNLAAQRLFRTGATPSNEGQTGPADTRIGFNPKDIVNKLLRAIDQSQVKFPEMKRHIDFGAVVAALSYPFAGEMRNLTAGETQEVEKLYQQHADDRTLKQDIFGGGKSGFDSDLTLDQRMRISALLGGTRAASNATAEEAQNAAGRQRNLDAVELHELLHGELEKDDIDRVMTILRRSAEANDALAASYERLYHVTLTGDFGRMGARHMIGALNLFMGRAVEADKMVIGSKSLRIEAINKEIAETKKKDFGGIVADVKIYQLQKEREQLVDEIEEQEQMSTAEVIKKGGDAKAVDAKVRSRAAAVLGDVNALAASVDGPDATLIRAIASDDPAAKAAAELRKAVVADKLTAAQVAATLRELRHQAHDRARRMLPSGDPGMDAKERSLADEYFARLRTQYDALVPGGGDSFYEILNETGDQGDKNLNKSLWVEAGQLADVEELVLALSGGRKDTEAVERVLRNKSATEIKLLKAQYVIRTFGRSLDYDLLGEAPTHSGEENPGFAGAYLKAQGKASGTSRLNLEDYLQRPDEEGGFAEVNYIASRAEREYDYTIENRGATGAWRDLWGNEQRDLLYETIKEVRRLYWLYTYSFMPNPKWADSTKAHGIVQQMRLARATIRGDRAAYEKATAELRATFEAVAAFALQAALTAVLGPLAELALVGELGEGATLALRAAKVAQDAIVGTASTIGANLAVYGSDYSLAMFEADLRGGMGGALGPALVGPCAKGLVSQLGPKLSGEIIKASETVVGKEIVGLGKTVAGMETGAWAQGESANLSVIGVSEAHGMAKGGEFISKPIKSRVEKRLGVGPHPAGGGAPEPTPSAALPTAPAAETALPAGERAAAAEPPVSEPAPTAVNAPAPKPREVNKHVVRRPAAVTKAQSGQQPEAEVPAGGAPRVPEGEETTATRPTEEAVQTRTTPREEGAGETDNLETTRPGGDSAEGTVRSGGVEAPPIGRPLPEPPGPPRSSPTTPVQPAKPSAGDSLVLRRMGAEARMRTARPANEDIGPGSVLPQAVAKNEEAAVRLGTGTQGRTIATPDVPASSTVTYQPSATRTPLRPDKRFAKGQEAIQGKLSPTASSGTARGLPTGSRATPTTTPSGAKSIEMPARRGDGLKQRMREFIKRAATIYRQEMSLQDKKLPIWEQSTHAHKNSLDRLRAEYKDVTEHGQPLTGVTGPGTASRPNVRIADATYVDLNSPARKYTPADLHIEFKAKAYPEQNGKVLRVSGEKTPDVTSDQIQAYEVAQTGLGVPSFVINSRGHIYALEGGRWIKVGGPE
jgi:hypothetical protein